MGNRFDRCGIVVNAQPGTVGLDRLREAVNTGHITSCILYQGASTEAQFDEYCQSAVPMLQDCDVAVMIADDTRLVGRCSADGIFLEKTRQQTAEIVERYAPEKMVGCGGFKGRHGALEAGEAKPDFVFFGRLGGDIRTDAHPKNLALCEWWSEIIEIPGIVLAGTSLESIVECAQTGADFVAVESYVFDGTRDPASAVVQAEEQLDLHAPRFEEVEA
ncbi:MAG: thiamine phosphate synthase [Pseudomonadota bacterium]